MANTIETIDKCVPFLDKKYRLEATSALLDADAETYRETENASTVLLPVMSMDGLGDYSRNDGFAKGDVRITYEPYTFACDRGRMFIVDAYDDSETAAVAFGKLAGEFIATQVAPELDAYRFSKYATMALASAGQFSGIATLDDSNVLDELDKGIAALDNAEVPDDDRVLFMSPLAYNALKKALGNTGRFVTTMGERRVEFLDGMEIIKVPASRMHTAYDFHSGTGDEVAGGFIPTNSAKAIHFLLMSKKAPMQIVKAAKLKIVTPEQNPDADAYKFGYRLYHDTFVPNCKKKGIYTCASV